MGAGEQLNRCFDKKVPAGMGRETLDFGLVTGRATGMV